MVVRRERREALVVGNIGESAVLLVRETAPILKVDSNGGHVVEFAHSGLI